MVRRVEAATGFDLVLHTSRDKFARPTWPFRFEAMPKRPRVHPEEADGGAVENTCLKQFQHRLEIAASRAYIRSEADDRAECSGRWIRVTCVAADHGSQEIRAPTLKRNRDINCSLLIRR